MPGNKLEVHHHSCEILYSEWSSGITVVRIYWNLDNNNKNLYKGKIKLELKNQIGCFADLSNILLLENIDIESINADSEYSSSDKSVGTANMIIKIKNNNELNYIIEKIKQSSFVLNI